MWRGVARTLQGWIKDDRVYELVAKMAVVKKTITRGSSPPDMSKAALREMLFDSEDTKELFDVEISRAFKKIHKPVKEVGRLCPDLPTSSDTGAAPPACRTVATVSCASLRCDYTTY